MKWSIHQLSKYRKNGLPIDTEVQLDEVKEKNKEIRHISPVSVKGHCNVDSTKMTCHFTMETTLTLPCARTWEDVEYPIKVDTVEIFDWSEGSHEENEADNIHYVDGEVVDLKPVLEELVLLEIPMQVYKEDPENVLESGKGWSYSTEETSQQKSDEKKVDPRLAGLAKFFDQTDE